MAMFVLSGIGPGIFSFTDAISRGTAVSMALITGVFAGAVLTPLFLPWVYGTMFSMKGLMTGLAVGIPTAVYYGSPSGVFGMLALLLISLSISSFLAMNFTGTTPYTSPSGVEKEMRKSIPVQSGAVILGVILWVYSGF